MADAYSELNDAMSKYVNDDENNFIVTGWLTVMSVSSINDLDGSNDGYLVVSSDGLPHHTQIGLLEVASNDIRNTALIATISSALSSIIDDDEDGDY